MGYECPNNDVGIPTLGYEECSPSPPRSAAANVYEGKTEDPGYEGELADGEYEGKTE